MVGIPGGPEPEPGPAEGPEEGPEDGPEDGPEEGPEDGPEEGGEVVSSGILVFTKFMNCTFLNVFFG